MYNRGGTGNFGKITEVDFPMFYYWAKRGFIVLASNYRFVNEKGSVDELGGSDIQDIISLHNLILELDYLDVNNVFMLGVSRGGMVV